MKSTFDMEMAKEWTSAFLDNLNNGGIWGVPRSDSAYQIWKDVKEYKIIANGEACINRVLEALGYKERT